LANFSLLEQYPDQWIAVFNQEVLDASSDARKLLVHLKIRGGAINQNPSKTLDPRRRGFHAPFGTLNLAP